MTAPSSTPPRAASRRRPARRRPRVLIGVATALVLALLAGCSSDPQTGEGGQPVTSASTDAERSLREVCPATVVVQTSWYPESTHGGLYQLLGKNYKINKGRKSVRGSLISRGTDTGVQLEIRAGGPALSNQPVSALMKIDPSITLGQQATEEQVRGWTAGQRTVALLAQLDVDPVGFFYDRKEHPEFANFADIGQTDTPVVSYDSANLDYLLGGGILRLSQVDRGYDGSPTRLMSDRKIVVGGFVTNELYIYKSMGVDVGHFSIDDYPNYRNMLVVRDGDQQKLDPCLRRLIPALQQGMVDFMADPEPVLRVIVGLTKAYNSPYPYPLEQARYGVEVMKTENIVTNPTAASMRGAPFGALNPERFTEMLTLMGPIYATQRTPIPAAATADALATNAYLDPSIRLPD